MRRLALAAALFVSAGVAAAALPGVTELEPPPEKIADSTLSRLLDGHVTTADVVAIGETVHASAGFLRVQTRLIQYLVTRHGFRLIAWENPVERSLELARWLGSCVHAKSPAPLDVLYLPTAADAPLWDWLCEFNRLHPRDPVIFRGVDIWDRPWAHHAKIRALGTAAGLDPLLLRSTDACPAAQASSWAEVPTVFPDGDYERCRTALVRLLEMTRGPGEVEIALSASTLIGWLGFYRYAWSDDVLSWNARDEAQGRNLSLLMEKHGVKRAILAAHTSHVSHNRSAADWWGFGDIKSGIHFFSRASGRKVFNIALTAYEASGAQGRWSLPTAANALDRKLHEAGHKLAFFLSSAPFLSENPRWWLQNQNAPPHENGVELVLRDHFDAFVFLDRSHVERPLPARPMWEP